LLYHRVSAHEQTFQFEPSGLLRYGFPGIRNLNQRTVMNTRNVKDKAERKKLKRAARQKQPAKPKSKEPRGSHKPKMKKKGPTAKR
jgi:hypothetical protein